LNTDVSFSGEERVDVGIKVHERILIALGFYPSFFLPQKCVMVEFDKVAGDVDVCFAPYITLN
jgi:hypothetical protein